MKKLLLTLISLILYSTASYATLGPLSPGSGGICIGSNLTVTEGDTMGGGTGGGSWTSSDPGIATVVAGGTYTGVVTGVSAGVVTITYTLGASYVTGTYTVAAAPAAISGSSTSFCVGSGTTLSDATPGGIWSSGYGGIATVSSTGIVTGVGGGVVNIYYTIGGACSVSITETVNANPMDYITGPVNVCVGSTIALADSIGILDSSTVSGTWTSSNTSIATVGSTGIVTGVSAGVDTILLAVTGICGIATSPPHIITVGEPSLGPISAPASLNVGETGSCSISGSGTWTGGTWSISPITVATINAASGVVTGVSAGSATITYSATACSSIISASTTIDITPLDGISGHVLFSSSYPGASVKVWLITYNTSTYMLEAIDSMYATGSDTSYFYQFIGVPTDSFRVKAAPIDDTVGVFDSSATVFIPTYHDTSFYWHNANVIYHISGTSDINEDINMLYGTATTGPGFIAGNVLTGANRGTSTSIPVVGLNIVAINTTTNTIAGMAVTDGSGNYSFSNLPFGTYTMFPDSLNYVTQPYTDIILNSSSPSFSSASFIQHTISNTITPIGEAVKNVTASSSTVSAFPNPTSGRLNIQWTEKATEKSTISVSDVTGREVYNTTVNMAQGSGMTAIDLSTFTNGMYMISIKSASLNYNSKIEVLH